MVNGPVAQVLAPLGARFTGLAVDSREIRPGDLFLAVPGESADGRRFISQAIASGAAGVAWESRDFTWNREWNVPNVPVPGLRERLGEIADAFYGHPSRHMTVVGVTGTNGKTSCSHWVAQALCSAGRKAAVIGTVGCGFPGELVAARNTTPDAVSLHGQLAALLAQGAQACAMEVSSHGLDQGRVNAVEFDTALFTNLSRDHLDYHGSMEAYAAAKARLFQWPGLRHAILNLDDPFGRRLAESLDRARTSVLGYGFGRGEIAGHDLVLATSGLEMDVDTPWGRARLASPMLGEFNASNLLGVLGVLLVSGIPLSGAIDALGRVRSVPGRMQLVREAGAPLAVIDYAHTPDALEKALVTLRRLLPAGGRLFCVFGCGGDRDAGKRPLMGEVATRLAHHAVVTSDNPRTEDPRSIIDAVVAGAHPNYSIEPDRAAAIALAIQQARAEDVVLVAGKGHETYQEVQGNLLPFDDAEVARELLRRRAGGARHA
jgi:UDP-N-acetylmuramoyl-L-alanyl-D-glutamate--2,6-diaminopimelate ligase